MNDQPWEDARLYADLDGDGDRDARQQLIRRLVDAGVSHDELLEAVGEERIGALPAELALGGETPYTITHVAREARLDPAFLRQVLLALGRPNPRRGERAFADGDIEQARILRSFLDAGLPRKDVIAVSRVLGQGMANTAVAIRELVADALLQRGDTELDLAFRYAEAAERLAPLLPPLLGNELLAHLREVVRREAVTNAERATGSIRGTRPVAIAFADLVDFTSLGGRLQPDELGRVASRLSDMTTALAGPPVQVVKTIGDAVMLASPDVTPLLDVLIGLLESWREQDGDTPELRAGIAYGPAINRAADWFGAPVNLASRLTDSAKAGTIQVDEAAQAEAGNGYDWPRRRRKHLKGIGRTAYFRLNPV